MRGFNGMRFQAKYPANDWVDVSCLGSCANAAPGQVSVPWPGNCRACRRGYRAGAAELHSAFISFSTFACAHRAMQLLTNLHSAFFLHPPTLQVLHARDGFAYNAYLVSWRTSSAAAEVSALAAFLPSAVAWASAAAFFRGLYGMLLALACPTCRGRL